MYDIVTQFVGFVAMAFCIGCYQIKSSRRLILCQMIGNLGYVLHYFMLGAYSGCVSMGLNAVSNLVISLRGSRRWANWKGWKWLFTILAAVSCILTWKISFRLIPCICVLIASIALTLGNWSGNGRTIRLIKLFIVSPGWIVFNIAFISYSGIICETFGIVSAIISIVRYGLRDIENDI